MKRQNCFISTVLLCLFITSCGNDGTVAKRKTLDTSASPSAVNGTMSTVTVVKTDSRYGGQYSISALQYSSCASEAENVLCAKKLVDIACNPSIYGCNPGQTYKDYKNFTYFNGCSAAADSATIVYSGACPTY